MSLVVPFAGGESDALALRHALSLLELEPGDELIVADNTAEGVAGPVLGEAARVIRATAEQSSYHARNRGAEVAGGEWILFLDADCVAAPDILDRYFSEPAPSDCGILAGSIVGVAEQDSLLARYTRSRGFYDGERGLGTNGANEGGAAPTGNLLVRRAAFEAVGGFAVGIRSAGDFDLCWRLQAAGWRLLRRPEAEVAHRHREDFGSFLSMLARYGAGANWINERYPGSSPRWSLVPGVLGSARDIVANLARGEPTEALYRGVDAIGLAAYNYGYGLTNEVEERA